MKYPDLQSQLAHNPSTQGYYGLQNAMWNAINGQSLRGLEMANALAPYQCSPSSKIERARERFGQPFAHEPGATWQPRKVPVLTEWMQSRGKEQKDETKNTEYVRVI